MSMPRMPEDPPPDALGAGGAPAREPRESPREAVELAFVKVRRDLDYLLQRFAVVIEETGDADLARQIQQFGQQVSPAPASSAVGLVQALSIAFALLNAVEENAAVQARRAREDLARQRPEPGLWRDCLERLTAAGVTATQIADALAEVRVEPVLTAHPTEAKRPTVLELHRELYTLLVQRENPIWTRCEREAIDAEVEAVLGRLWRTGNIFLRKPDVASEVRNVLHYFREVFPTVLPLVDRRLEDAWRSLGLDSAALPCGPRLPRVSFGSWVGGDRDGHPLVTAAVTEQTLAQLRAQALELVGGELRRLGRRLGLSARRAVPPAALVARVEELIEALGPKGEAVARANPEEPWRQLLGLMLARLPEPVPSAREVGAAHVYRDADELLADLRFVRESLVEARAERLATAEVDPALRRIAAFGFHLAALDIRQNSAAHDRALTQLLCAAGIDAADFAAWSEPRRMALLEQELALPRPFVGAVDCGGEAGETLATYRLLRRQLETHGSAGIGALIVSMTRQLSDLLVPYLFAREVGLAQHGTDGLVCRIPVVPLFETTADLGRSAGIVSAFLDHPVTRRSLELQRATSNARRWVAQVMVGYSDSNKDAGILASSWYLYRAQREIADVGRERGVKVRFFHGRGGTNSRGAGPTHRFLSALPAGALDGDLRITEQGETIAQKYANRLTAVYNLELLLAGTVRETLLATQAAPASPSALEPAMERLAASSRRAYRSLVETPRFIDFFRQATPIDAIEAARIGSRPPRRGGRPQLSDLRAIPWVFSWSQARFFLSGWYGVGSALEELRHVDPQGFASVCEQALSWPPLRYLITNVSTSLASASLEAMRAYAQLVVDVALRDRIMGQIAGEFERTRAIVDCLFRGTFEQRRPKLFQTLALRRPALETLHALQIDQLRAWRALREVDLRQADASRQLDDLLLTVNAIASGLRTTG